MSRALLVVVLMSLTSPLAQAKNLLHSFKKVQATDQFWAEGADIGDFNHDGKVDVVSGPFWYEGPDFTRRHEIWPATATFKRKFIPNFSSSALSFLSSLVTLPTFLNDKSN